MRLIDADAFVRDLEYDIELCGKALNDDDLVGKEREYIQLEKDCKQNCLWYIGETPTIDAAPVVRCGECRHMQSDGRCTEFADDRIYPSASDFCSYGKRREEEHNAAD